MRQSLERAFFIRPTETAAAHSEKREMPMAEREQGRGSLTRGKEQEETSEILFLGMALHSGHEARVAAHAFVLSGGILHAFIQREETHTFALP